MSVGWFRVVLCCVVLRASSPATAARPCSLPPLPPFRRYWFDLVDIDGDGVVTPYDMRIFFDEQSRRMECLGHDAVPFADVLCQMTDLVKPEVDGMIRVPDLLVPDKLQISGALFDVLFSLDRFVAFEQRDPFAERQKREDPYSSDWERFAAAEYARLAAEEEQREAGYDDSMFDAGAGGDWGMSNLSMDGVSAANEAPF